METLTFVSGICFAASLYELHRIAEYRKMNCMTWWLDYVRVSVPAILFLAGTLIKLVRS